MTSEETPAAPPAEETPTEQTETPTEQTETPIEQTETPVENEENNIDKLKRMIEDLQKENREFLKSKQSMEEDIKSFDIESQTRKKDIEGKQAHFDTLNDRYTKSVQILETETEQNDKVAKVYNDYKNRIDIINEIKKDDKYFNNEISKCENELNDIQKNVNSTVVKYPDLEKKSFHYQVLYMLLNINNLFTSEAKNCLAYNDSNPDVLDTAEIEELKEKVNKGEELKNEFSLSEGSKFKEVEEPITDFSYQLERCLPIYNQIFLFNTTKSQVIDQPKAEEKHEEKNEEQTEENADDTNEEHPEEKNEEQTLDTRDSSLQYSFVYGNYESENKNELLRISDNDQYEYLNDPGRADMYQKLRSLFTLIPEKPEKLEPILTPEKIKDMIEEEEEPEEEKKEDEKNLLSLDPLKNLVGQEGEQPTEDKTEEKVEEPTEEKTEEKVEEPTEDKTEEKVEEPTEEKTEEKTEEPTEEKAEEKTEERAVLTTEPLNSLLGTNEEEPVEKLEQPMSADTLKNIVEQPETEEEKKAEEPIEKLEQPMSADTLKNVVEQPETTEEPVEKLDNPLSELVENVQAITEQPKEEEPPIEKLEQPLTEETLKNVVEPPKEEEPTGQPLSTEPLNNLLNPVAEGEEKTEEPNPEEQKNENTTEEEEQGEAPKTERNLESSEQKQESNEPKVDTKNMKNFLGTSNKNTRQQTKTYNLQDYPEDTEILQLTDTIPPRIEQTEIKERKTQAPRRPYIKPKPYINKDKTPHVSTYDPSIFFTPLTSIGNDNENTNKPLSTSKYTDPPPLTITLKDIGLEGLDSPVPDRTQQIKQEEEKEKEKEKAREAKEARASRRSARRRARNNDESGNNSLQNMNSAKVVKPVTSPNGQSDATFNSQGPKSPRRSKRSSRRNQKVPPLEQQQSQQGGEEDVNETKRPPSLLESAQNSSSKPQTIIPRPGSKTKLSRSNSAGSGNELKVAVPPNEEESSHEKSPRRLSGLKSDEQPENQEQQTQEEQQPHEPEQ